jgi:alpha-ketoglutarate-dependent 2,4-dichlorophenoxyacetate dioxygenase
MPHAENFKYIQVLPIHPTFGAEVSGIDFSKPIPDGQFNELLVAATQVSMTRKTYYKIENFQAMSQLPNMYTLSRGNVSVH